MIVKRTPALLAAVITAMLALTIGAVSIAQAQTAGCSVSYTAPSQWPGGFTASVSVTNLGSPVSGWSLTWSYSAGQQVVQGWNADFPATGPQVEARNAAWNADIGTGGSVSFGFIGSWNNASNPPPDTFALNGTQCNGGTTTPSPTSPSPTTPPPGGSLPSSFQWSSSGPLAAPMQVDPARTFVSVKDFAVARHNNQWQIYATTASTAGNWSLVHFSFADWPQAGSAPQTQLDMASAIGPGYRAAPQLFYFAPQDLWYLVFQTGPPTYSTSTDPSDPTSWSAPQLLMSSEPPILQQNKGDGQWLDFWVICDSANCYLFFSDLNGHLYRAQTTVGNFPNGFGNTVIVLDDPDRFPLWEAANVYKVQGEDQYLLLVEAIGSDGARWFRSWTSTSIAGSWTPLANTESNPFARSNNVTFPGGAWTQDISHGDMLRVNNDQTQTIDPCNLQYVYQGRDPSSDGQPYSQLPYRMGLLTHTNSTC